VTYELGIRQPVNPDVRHPELFTSPTRRSCETEIRELIAALVFITKPDLVLEAGIAEGYTTLAIAQALARNGAGELHGIDIDLTQVPEARKQEITHGGWAELHEASYRDYHPPGSIHLAFYDATLDEKDEVVMHFSPWYQKGTMLLLHDLGYGRHGDMKKPKRAEQAFARVPTHLYRRIHFRTPNGLTILEWLGEEEE
jgi:predicted O-methyltransferase YrrM